MCVCKQPKQPSLSFCHADATPPDLFTASNWSSKPNLDEKRVGVLVRGSASKLPEWVLWAVIACSNCEINTTFFLALIGPLKGQGETVNFHIRRIQSTGSWRSVIVSGIQIGSKKGGLMDSIITVVLNNIYSH